jgi:hypothetical protein
MRHKIPTVCHDGQVEMTIRVDRKSYEILKAVAYGLPFHTVEEYATEILQEQFPRSMWQQLQKDKDFFRSLKKT